MVIGIDDSGNFDTDDLSFFVAAFIRPKKRERIKGIFHAWESSLPSTVKNSQGEVKGYLLADNQLLSFVEVVLRNPVYGVRYRAYAISTGDENRQNVIKQRDRNIGQIQTAIDSYRDQGAKYFTIADEYMTLMNWLAKRSTKTLLKIELLGMAIVDALNTAIIKSAVSGFDKELAQLEFKIDQSFVGKPEQLSFWRDIIRSQLWHLSFVRQSITHINTWNSHHPFVKKFYNLEQSTKEKFVFTSAFKNSLDFYDSSDNFEIRIADIIASAIFRRDVEGERLLSVNEIMKANLYERPYTIMLLTDNHAKVPNPYTEF